MDYIDALWILANGLIWPLIGIIWTYRQGIKSRKEAEKKFEKRVRKVEKRLEEAIDKLPGRILQSLGGKSNELVSEVTKSSEWERLMGDIKGEDRKMVDQVVTGSSLGEKYGGRFLDMVTKGLAKKATDRLDGMFK